MWDVNCSISTSSAKRGQCFKNYRRSFRLGRDAEGSWSSAKIETNSVTKAKTCSEKHKDYYVEIFFTTCRRRRRRRLLELPIRELKQTTEDDVMKLYSIWMDPLIKLLQWKTFFHARSNQKPFYWELRMVTMVRRSRFDGAVIEKHSFNFQRSVSPPGIYN